MTPLEVDESDPPACFLLGIVDDRRSHFTYPHPAHRCFAAKRPQTTDVQRQRSFCLSTDFVACDRYLASQGTRATDGQQRPRRSTEAGPAAQASEAPPVGDGSPEVVYVFRTGDSLGRIASSYGLTIEQIVAMNQLDPNVPVKDGARLVIKLDRPSRDTSGAGRTRSKAAK